MPRLHRFSRRAALAGAAAALALTGLLAIPSIAQPPGPPPGAGGGFPGAALGHGPGEFPLRALTAFLDLSDAQVEETRALLQDLAAELRPLAEEARALREELAALLDADDPGSAEVGALVLELHVIGDRIQAARDAFDADFTALLDPIQVERWQILKEAREAFSRGPHGRRHAPRRFARP